MIRKLWLINDSFSHLCAWGYFPQSFHFHKVSQYLVSWLAIIYINIWYFNYLLKYYLPHKEFVSIVVLENRKSNLFTKQYSKACRKLNEVCISNYWGIMIISNKHIQQEVSMHFARYLLTQKHIRVELTFLFSRYMMFTL